MLGKILIVDSTSEVKKNYINILLKKEIYIFLNQRYKIVSKIKF